MLEQILDWTDNIAIIFLILAVGIWGVYFKSLAKSFQFFGTYLLLNLLVQIGAYLLWRNVLNNLPLLHLNTLFEFIFISLFFREVYIEQRFLKKYFFHIVGGISLLILLNSIFFESIYGFNSRAKTSVQIILIGYVILFFFDNYGKVDFSKREAQAVLILCFNILFYYSGSLFVFMFSQFSFNEAIQEEYLIIWVINAVLNAIFQFIALVALFHVSRQRDIGNA